MDRQYHVSRPTNTLRRNDDVSPALTEGGRFYYKGYGNGRKRMISSLSRIIWKDFPGLLDFARFSPRTVRKDGKFALLCGSTHAFAGPTISCLLTDQYPSAGTTISRWHSRREAGFIIQDTEMAEKERFLTFPVYSENSPTARFCTIPHDLIRGQ
jgi:hypothetical protein